VPGTFRRFAGVPVGISVTATPGTFVQSSWTTELPVFKAQSESKTNQAERSCKTAQASFGVKNIKMKLHIVREWR
jgi:hypothetical protein